ncbi:hypothetical protein V8C35DRAFT_333716 [Trichoderma chlorosporum]
MTEQKASRLLQPIAIVGIGLRLPAGISTTGAFWDLLVNKQDCRCRVPFSRYRIGSFHDPKSKDQAVASAYGYFLEDADLKTFDTNFFSMNKSEVEMLDPQQRLLLQVTWECMENAGQRAWCGTNIGCYVGSFGEDWNLILHKDPLAQGFRRINGAGDFALSNRLSYEFDLKGPSMTIRSACSSSLVSLHEACQALHNGECSSAIVAGVSLILGPSMTEDMTEQGALSPTGTCRAFDAGADGTVRGEGVNVIFIKLLDEAIRDNDPIRAVIRSTAVNCDGKTQGMSCPSSEAQESLIRRAYQAANISDLSKTAYVECHGTGTQIGDPIETTAVANVFGKHGVYIGSVKPNVGHSEAASGISGLIKGVLALEHQMIPPNINFSIPNPKIPFRSGRLTVPIEATPWPKDRSSRVSVNSFGIGGVNAHVIIDSAVSFAVVRPKTSSSSPGLVNIDDGGLGTSDEQVHDATEIPGCFKTNRGHSQIALRLIPISAKSPASLEAKARDLCSYAKARLGSIDAIAHTLGMRRDHLSHRTFCISTSEKSIDFSRPLKSHTVPSPVVFIFNGQGAQWAGMVKNVILDLPSFLKDIREMDQVLQKINEPPQWLLEDIFRSGKIEEFLDKPEVCQTLCTGLQIATVNFIQHCGVNPIAVIGHSSGEIAAAYAAGAITSSEAILTSYFRGIAVKSQTRKGCMAAIGIGAKAISASLADGAIVACENSPKSTTISGDIDAVRLSIEMIKAREPSVFARQLRVNVAYHSHHMREVGYEYEKNLLHHLEDGTKPTIPLYSAVTGQRTKDPLGPAYWRRNLESRVLFHGAMRSLLSDLGNKVVFVEVGPHSTLQGPLRDIFQECSEESPTYLPTIIRSNDPTYSLLTTIGRLYQEGCAIDFSFINPSTEVLTNLPMYAWDHNAEHWNESRMSQKWRQKKYRHHELLGSQSLECSDIEPSWRNLLSIDKVSWLRDHIILNDVVFPCVGYVAMLGEAIKQVTGSRSYALRDLIVKSALILRESETIEILTTMKPCRLTETTNSSWYDFSICSYNGASWVQHCVAQGKAGEECASHDEGIIPYHRRISQNLWYKALWHRGLKFGPRFRGMEDISAHPEKKAATASIRNDTHNDTYAIHPTTLDHSLQLFSVAMSNGVARRFENLVLPSTIRYICVKPGGPALTVEATACVSRTGVICGDTIAVTGANEVAIRVKSMTMVPFIAGEHPEKPSFPAARLDWRPAVGFLNTTDLIRCTSTKRDARILLDRICALCILQSLDALKNLEIPSDYLGKYAAWLEGQRHGMIRGEWDLCAPEAQQWVCLGVGPRTALTGQLLDQLRSLDDNEALVVGRTLCKISDSRNIQDIFSGSISPLQLLLEDNCLKEIYNFNRGIVDSSEYFSLGAHSKPTMRILEIGAGTGAATEDVLKAITSKDGIRMYSEYTFTDISPGFFAAAKERFKQYTGITYKVLDISQDPAEQGFKLGQYDLILAANVLHATASIHETLKNVRSLLRNGGRLFLEELVQPMMWRWGSFIMGTLPGWWLGHDDGRSSEPFVSVGRWDKEFRDAGFLGVQAAVEDDAYPYQLNASIVTTPAGKEVPLEQEVIFLYDKEKPAFSMEMANYFGKSGYQVRWSKLADQDHCSNRDIISVIDLERPFFHEISTEDYENFTSYLSKLRAGMLWITKAAQIRCTDPRYGIVIGLARTIRSELSHDFSTVELQTLNGASIEAVFSIFRKFQQRYLSADADYDPEMEFAVHDGIIHTARYHWFSLRSALDSSLCSDDPKRLIIGDDGLIDTMKWVQSAQRDIQAHEVEVDVRYVGLNFKDILQVMKAVDNPTDGIGHEASGTVIRIGSLVKHVTIGDRVIAFGRGCFTTRIVAHGQHVAPIPRDLSLEDAATMPMVYVTAIHALVNIGQLTAGQSVLIHSACGGVGLAAIQVCQMLKAEIYATVSSEQKAQHLVDTFGLSRENIFYSRGVSFLQDVHRATSGRGVDVVLNSLAGELLQASWQCVAKYGKMIELGKRDLIGRGHLMLNPFDGNRAFYGIDLDQLAYDRPEEMHQLMKQSIAYYQQGCIKPIHPIHLYQAQQVTDAFRFIQNGHHIGKVVVRIPEEPARITATEIQADLVFSRTSTYLLAGGLGGLGKAVTTWMIERNARNFVFISPSAGISGESQSFLRELEGQGCQVSVIAGSLSEPADVERAVQAAPTPIAGVMQMSMLLKDDSLLELKHADWAAVQSPKIKGTWNLHKALLGTDLDFFILFGSISGVFGQPGQANYAAANTFLDSFSQYRHSLKLPCSVIDIGFMDEVGYMSRNTAMSNQFQAMGYCQLQEKDLLNAIEFSIKEALAQTASFPASNVYNGTDHFVIGLSSSKFLSDPANRVAWKRDVRMSLFRQLEQPNQQDAAEDRRNLGQLLNSAAVNPTILYTPETLEFVTKEIGAALCTLMMKPTEGLDTTMTLTSMGVDSLVSIEIRNWWRRSLGVDISVLEISTSGTIERLGRLAIMSLQDKYKAKEARLADLGTSAIHAHIRFKNDAVGIHEEESREGIDLLTEISSIIGTFQDFQDLPTQPAVTLCVATVFLTGATGYLGTEILHQLLRCPTVHKVVVLVRADNVRLGLDRVKKRAQLAGWWHPDDEQNVEVWQGDLAAESFGLDKDQWLRLCGKSSSTAKIDAIIHNGAAVNWVASYSDLRKTNIESAVQLLKIAIRSTTFPKYVYISGGMKKRASETQNDFAANLLNWAGYFQTKFVAESVIRKIASRLPADQKRVSIVKPGLIIGTAASGAANTDDVLWRAVATAAGIGLTPVHPEGGWLYLGEVDTVACQVVKQVVGRGGVVPFVDIVDGIYLDKFWEIVNDEVGGACSRVPWIEWARSCEAHIAQVGQVHPMWAMQEYLDHRKWSMEIPLSTKDSDSLCLAVRNNIRYLQLQKYISLPGQGLGGYMKKALGRSSIL